MKTKEDTLAIKCPVSLHKKIKAAAKKEKVSLKDWMISACQNKLPKPKKLSD